MVSYIHSANTYVNNNEQEIFHKKCFENTCQNFTLFIVMLFVSFCPEKKTTSAFRYFVMNEWMNERKKERKKERMNEWMNELGLWEFVGLALAGKDIVFRFIIEYYLVAWGIFMGP
jgi:hypothetical protein